MKLHLKLIICYVATVFAIFFCVNYVGNRILERSIKEELLKEYSSDAQHIAQVYEDLYFDANVSMAQVKKQMTTYDAMIDARIWIVNAMHLVVVDSRGNGAIPVDTYSKELLKQIYSENVMFEGIFSEPMFCINEPIVISYAVKGYICLFVPMSEIQSRSEST